MQMSRQPPQPDSPMAHAIMVLRNNPQTPYMAVGCTSTVKSPTPLPTLHATAPHPILATMPDVEESFGCEVGLTEKL